MMISGDKKKRVGHRREWSISRGCICELILLLAVVALAACYPAPYRTVSPYEPRVVSESPGIPPEPSSVLIEGRVVNEQQSRDHYECYNWAVKQTGFDPGQSVIPTNQRVRVVPMPPPGHDTATLAIAGAVLARWISNAKARRGWRLDRRIRRGYCRRCIGFGKRGIGTTAREGLRAAKTWLATPNLKRRPAIPAGDVRLHGRKGYSVR